MTDKRSNKLAEQCMSCIKCDSDFDGVTGFRELVTEKENDKQYVPMLGNSVWDFSKDRELTNYEICDLLNNFKQENEQLKQQMQTILKLTKKIEDCTHDIKMIGDVE